MKKARSQGNTKRLPPKTLNVFTRFPPPTDNTIVDIPVAEVAKYLGTARAYVTQLDIDPFTHLILQAREKSFKETGNPVYAIEAFLIARDAKLYPPFWALEWLFKGFEEYHKSNGKTRIDRLLGFNGRVFKKLIEEERNEWIMKNVWRLNKFGGYSIETASKMVAYNLKDFPEWNKSGLKFRKLEYDRIEILYYEKWSVIFKELETNKNFIESERKSFEENREVYLNRFHNIPNVHRRGRRGVNRAEVINYFK